MDDQLTRILYEVGIFLYSFRHILIPLTARKVAQTYKLNKETEPKDFRKVYLPPELKQKYTSVEINQIASRKIKKALVEFSDVMINNFPEDTLTNFYNNINELKVKKNIWIVFLGSGGSYSCKLNRVTVAGMDSIFHELFHMATSRYKNDVRFSGFHQFYYKPEPFDIGRGINEGYTEMMTRRYFGKKHRMEKVYQEEVAITEKLEQIVGKEEMESLYLNSNLPGLIRFLMQYATKKEVESFISSVDLICGHAKAFYLLKSEKVENAFKTTYSFLYRVYLSKLKKRLDSGEIDADTFVAEYLKYVEGLKFDKTIGGHHYQFATNESISKDLESVFGTSQLFLNIKGNGGTIKK